MPNVAINGLGRIGRAALKLLLDSPGMDLVAVNDIASLESLAYLLRYDTAYGRYHRQVRADGHSLVIGDRRIRAFAEGDPEDLPWKELDVDLVLECTGVFTHLEDLTKHVTAGASLVIVSAPSKSDDVPTVVHGVNRPDGHPQIISCASCTTNCIAPVVEIAQRRTRRRARRDDHHARLHREPAAGRLANRSFRSGRAGAVNLVPASTGAAKATIKAVPELADRFDGIAIRAPIVVGSIADIVVATSRATTTEEVNDVFTQEAQTERYRGILGVSWDPLVSSDIIGDPRATVVDLDLTRVVDGTLVKIMAVRQRVGLHEPDGPGSPDQPWAPRHL